VPLIFKCGGGFSPMTNAKFLIITKSIQLIQAANNKFHFSSTHTIQKSAPRKKLGDFYPHKFLEVGDLLLHFRPIGKLRE